jgi:hypothetical protein
MNSFCSKSCGPGEGYKSGIARFITLFCRSLTSGLCRGVPFETESSLRTRGAYKTPDVRLIVPMAMKGPTGSWHVITWMDSKAMFGDLDTFEREVSLRGALKSHDIHS